MPLAAAPAKRHLERLILAYTPVWIGAVAVLMLTRVFATWGDVGHLAIGVGLALPVWLMPLLWPGPERDVPFAARYATRFNLWMTLFSFIQVYFGSDLFFDVLGMEYHFHTTWIVHRSPLFLYFMTIAYFATYYVVMSLLWRTFLRRFPTAPAPARWLVRAALGYATAFAETAGMANPMLRDFFFYRDKSFVLLFGSLCYGTVFFISLPLVFRIGEDEAAPQPSLRAIAWDVLAANSLVLVCYAVFAAMAPR